MSKFVSGFAAKLDAMLDYRQALGFSRRTHESSLMSFDRYCATHYPDAVSMNKEMVLGWIGEQMGKSRSNITEKATAIRMFGKYLSAIGRNAYILPESYVSQRNVFTPYIFTDEELTALFRAIDCLQKGFADPTASEIAPVLFRLIYTCGLRPNEGRELKRQSINFGTGEIFITKTKRKKERVVVMSDDMLGLSKEYDARRDTFAGDYGFFFPRQDGRAYTSLQLERLLKKCWAIANPSVPADKLPNVRVYDLRHRFASAVLNRWLDNGRDLYAMLPYLRAYMGHDHMSETAYYIHILPENISKCAGIDWATFDALIPEVKVWQE